MKAIIYGLMLICMMSLVGCGDCGNVAKLSGSGAGTILTSSNGSSWAGQVSGTASQLNYVTFGNGQFVTVGASGTILTSPDGMTWTGRTSGTTFNLYGATYGTVGNGLFVVVGDGGTILTSPDGITWTTRASSPIANQLIGVTFADGQFVAVGYSGIMYSSDGVNWNSVATQSSGITGPTVDLYSVAFGNNRFVTVGTYNGSQMSYNGLIGTSPDGSTWTTLPYTSNYLSGVTYGGGQFVAVGREGSILTSPDGSTWTPQTAAPIANSTLTPYLISVIHADGQYVAVGNYVGTNPSTGFILTSSDGKNWSMATTGTTSNLYGIGYGVVSGVGTYVAVGGQ
ncbi:MAG: hypothetical protein P4L44_15875 [Oryzomonas sp.]|uniref:hypothetical protein n=1 Tax=Oryzomonas sp. TaxID=2855186 RepID=UPI00284931EF|nr:hypothetical protein [Oryzomonas sp.]MDR3581440.1 hypothetical protein [Oryzomonas sp.]